jgi:anti-sigma factor RsiW
MTKHVSHLLASYTEGQLGKRRTRRVQQHVAACPACYEKLARHERLAADLRLTLGQAAQTFHQPQSAVWYTASSRLNLAGSSLSPATLIPILLSLALLVAPLISAGTGPTAPGITPRLNATLLSTEAIAMQAPATEAGQAQTVLATTAFEDSPPLASTPPPPGAAVLAESVPIPPSSPDATADQADPRINE